MANEISVNLNLSYTNANLKSTFAPGSISITQAAQGLHAPVVTVGSTAEENLVTGDIGTLGYVVGRNLDATNYVTIGPSTGGAMYPFLRVNAGEVFAFRLSQGITWRWKANAANVKVQLQLYEN